MQLSKHIYLVSGGSYGLLGNVYALRGQSGVALVDCGQAAAHQNIRRSLAYWGMEGLPVTAVFLTHGHEDHAGGAAHFQRHGAKIYISRADAPRLEMEGMPPVETRWNGQEVFPACQADVLFEAGDTLLFEDFAICAVAAAGHTAGSIFFQMRDGEKDILFTGDAISCEGEEGEGVNLGWRGSFDYSAADFEKTLAAAFGTLNPDFVLGGHGIPCVRDGKRVLLNAYRKFLAECR